MHRTRVQDECERVAHRDLHEFFPSEPHSARRSACQCQFAVICLLPHHSVGSDDASAAAIWWRWQWRRDTMSNAHHFQKHQRRCVIPWSIAGEEEVKYARSKRKKIISISWPFSRTNYSLMSWNIKMSVFRTPPFYPHGNTMQGNSNGPRKQCHVKQRRSKTRNAINATSRVSCCGPFVH